MERMPAADPIDWRSKEGRVPVENAIEAVGKRNMTGTIIWQGETCQVRKLEMAEAEALLEERRRHGMRWLEYCGDHSAWQYSEWGGGSDGYGPYINFKDGQAFVSNEKGEDVCIDEDGRMLYSVDRLKEEKGYQYVNEEWSEGRRLVSLYPEGQVLRHDEDFGGGWYGYIDAGGREVIPPQYTDARDFQHRRAAVSRGRVENDWIEEETWGVIDRDGHEVIPCQFAEIAALNDTACLFGVRQFDKDGGLWGIMDSQGRWVAEPQFGYIYDGDNMEDSGFIIFANKYWEYPDARFGAYDLKKKTVLIAPAYTFLEWDALGYFIGYLPDPENAEGDGDVVVLSEKGDILFRGGRENITVLTKDRFFLSEIPQETVSSLQHRRVVDAEGHDLIPAGRYENLQKIDPCGNEVPVLGFTDQGKWGTLTFDGEVMVPPLYECLCQAGPKFLMAKKEGKWGILDRTGRTVLPCRYDWMGKDGDHLWAAEKEGEIEVYVAEEK